ncbi:MAG: cytochrome c [Pseudomonadota bacterium]
MGISAKVGLVAAVAVAVSFGVASTGTIDAAMTGEAAIKERIAAMKAITKEWNVIRSFGKDDKVTAAVVAEKATIMANLSKQIPAMFPEGSGRGDFSDKETRALPAIWTDWPSFESASTVMVVESEKLANFAKAGDTGAIPEQIAQVGRLGCGGCHKAYRGAKVR